MNDPPDSVSCDNMVEGWLKFEIRILLMWLSACAIFLLYAQFFRFKSKWKIVEEKLDLLDIWNMKNSQDYLHHMRLE